MPRNLPINTHKAEEEPTVTLPRPPSLSEPGSSTGIMEISHSGGESNSETRRISYNTTLRAVLGRKAQQEDRQRMMDIHGGRVDRMASGTPSAKCGILPRPEQESQSFRELWRTAGTASAKALKQDRARDKQQGEGQHSWSELA